MSDLFLGPSNSLNAFRTILREKLNFVKDSKLKKVTVLDVDVNGSEFYEDSPKNSIVFQTEDEIGIKEEVLLDSVSNYAVPITNFPVKCGEDVWIFYPDEKINMAVWFPYNFDSTKYKESELLEKKSKKRITDEAGNEFSSIIEEGIPNLIRRMGDKLIQATNNAFIYISRDRPNKPDSGHEEKAGLIYFVSGLASENIDLENDESYIYLSQKTDIDDNLKDTDDPKKETPAIAIKSKNLRFKFKEDFRLYNDNANIQVKEDGSITIKNKSGAKVFLDKNGNLTFDKIKEMKLGNQGKAFVTFDELKAYLTTLESAITASTTPGNGAKLVFTAPGGLQANALLNY